MPIRIEIRRETRWSNAGRVRFGIALIALVVTLALSRRASRFAWLAPVAVLAELFWFGFDYLAVGVSFVLETALSGVLAIFA